MYTVFTRITHTPTFLKVKWLCEFVRLSSILFLDSKASLTAAVFTLVSIEEDDDNDEEEEDDDRKSCARKICSIRYVKLHIRASVDALCIGLARVRSHVSAYNAAALLAREQQAEPQKHTARIHRPIYSSSNTF